jgi:hypothetical protein
MTWPMNGTLALWYESKADPDPDERVDNNAAAGTGMEVGDPDKPVPSEEVGVPVVPPVVRLHVNLWRDIGKKFNFLDVGFNLEETADLDRLYLYLPAPIEITSIYDLSNALKDADTLNAVFNEVAVVEREADEHFIIKTDNSRRIIHNVDPSRDVSVLPVPIPGRPCGTTITLKSALCARINDPNNKAPQHYVRLRIFLHGDAQNLFTTEDGATSLGLSLTQDMLETTEFRLNERRSFPHVILERAAKGQVRLGSVHYFLIRSKDHQLGSQHQNFRKVRHLEPDIWTSYLRVGQPASRRWSRRPRADGMIIYQWRAIALNDKVTNKPVYLDDFIAYASFRIAKDKILAYFVAALAIGGVGGALLNIGLSGLAWFLRIIERGPYGNGVSNLITGFILGVLALTPMWLSKLRRWWRKR